ncbi:hypothetical protein Rumeso_00595 [Rubellimicrobium mesophilum DSM 19309]|uniref:LCCL domain-containing protein n=1 Tax=Rubellimicrobium mesophilum DSM 19309 TaxID=442562 RepID=A0A017HUM4_9RHOB|nr:LCCL domain-containing protein [Rubellimicrobium mesophilum]EYD77868.1 hypothetical protein Rumeso_00595 [Rubellimicrobium mesophilum DSM 19309]
MKAHVLAVLMALPAAPALADPGQCATFPDSAESLSCSCPSGFVPGAVWGSGPYTADSDICTAALHAGVLGVEGGPVTANRVAPPSAYRGSAANGVTTSDYGSYPSAYVIAGAAENTGEKTCGPLEAMAVSTCVCQSDAPQRSVWGSGPYTADSDICTAARHAGVIGAEGGEVTVRRVAGQESYAGGTANGVTTSSYGSYGASFTFGAK